MNKAKLIKRYLLEGESFIKESSINIGMALFEILNNFLNY